MGVSFCNSLIKKATKTQDYTKEIIWKAEN